MSKKSSYRSIGNTDARHGIIFAVADFCVICVIVARWGRTPERPSGLLSTFFGVKLRGLQFCSRSRSIVADVEFVRGVPITERFALLA